MEDQLILNRYRPITEAGSGGFATVQLAWDTRIQRRVAIKCIQLKEEELDQAVIPGLDEARTAAMLTDGNIVGVYDFEVQGNTAFLIMEYVDGLTLTQLLETYGNELSLDVIAAVFSAVAHALEIAHDNQVLHLDIKPDNILINRQGQVKVTDFGLARLSDASGFGAASGGTIGYMPLEQMRQEALDGRCDEWALASITYEMLVGENPFLAPNLGAAEAAIENAEIVLPSLCKDGLDPEADDVVFFALDPDREERYRSVADFAEEMEVHLGNPVKGQRELAVLVGQAAEDYAEEDDFIERTSFLDRISERTLMIFARIWSLISVGLLGFIAFANMPFTGGINDPIIWGVVALFAIGALFKPHLGTVLGLYAFGVSLMANQAILVGILLLIISTFWWFFVGRKGDNQANTALSPVLFGAFGLNQVSPLLVGFCLDIKETIINTVMVFFLGVVLAGLGSQSLFGWDLLAHWNFETVDVQGNIWAVLSRPATWIMFVAWIAAAILVRVFCLRYTRLFAFLGVILATGVLFFACMLGSYLEVGSWLPEWQITVTTLGAGALISVLCAFGVPIRTADYDYLD